MKTRKTFPIRMIWAALTAVLALSVTGQMNAQPTETTRSFGDVRVLGTVPASKMGVSLKALHRPRVGGGATIS